MGKKKSRRSQLKHPALNSRYMPKVRREYFDIDYLNKLSEEPTIEMPDGSFISEKDWMNRFVEEELNASFKDDGLDLTTDKEERKKIYGRNNARNRCLYGVSKANGMLSDTDHTENDVKYHNNELVEDALIAEIDRKKEEE